MIRYNKKVRAFSNSYGGVVVNVVVLEAQGGENRFSACPTSRMGRTTINGTQHDLGFDFQRD